MLWMMNNKLVAKEDLAKLIEALPDCTIYTRGTNPLSADWRTAAIYHEFEIASGLIPPDLSPTPEPSITPDPSATPSPSDEPTDEPLG